MWDERYATADYVYGTAPNTFLRSVADTFPAGSRILCLAEGEGRNAVYLAGLGHEVVAVDQSATGLEKAQRLAQAQGVMIDTVIADLADYEIAPGRFDVVVSIFCHVPPDLRASLHARVVAGLTPGGLFVLEAYTPEQLPLKTGGPPTAEMMMSLAGLQQELEGLTFRHAAELRREVIEGTLHSGIGAVVQIVGVKE